MPQGRVRASERPALVYSKAVGAGFRLSSLPDRIATGNTSQGLASLARSGRQADPSRIGLSERRPATRRHGPYPGQLVDGRL